jgi:hypothetical protein
MGEWNPGLAASLAGQTHFVEAIPTANSLIMLQALFSLSACFCLHWAVALLAAVCTVHASALLTNPQLPPLLLSDDDVNLLRTKVTHHHQHLQASSQTA